MSTSMKFCRINTLRSIATKWVSPEIKSISPNKISLELNVIAEFEKSKHAFNKNRDACFVCEKVNKLTPAPSKRFFLPVIFYWKTKTDYIGNIRCSKTTR